MRKLTFAQNRAIFTFSRATIFIWMMIMATNVQSWSQCTPESNTISGTVFEDAINDGTFKSTETGLGNVLVTAYGADGNSVGSVISDANGNYSILNLSDDTPYRLEFQSSAGYYAGFQGEDNRSSVQFVNAPACEVNYGLTREISSCGSNPELLLTCFVQGEITDHPDFATIISTEHDFQAASSVTALTTASETGSIWGLAQDVIDQNLFSTAFVKQYAGLKYGPYAILKTELEGEKKTTKFVDVNDLIPQTLAGLTVTEDVHDCTYGSQVGRIGLGNLVVSADSRTLYTPVLDENLVVAIKINDPTAEATKVFEMPRPVGIDAAEEYKIFALEWHDNLLYVGGTVTGSVSQDKSKSLAVIMTLDPETGDINEIFRTSYLKGFWQDEKPASLAVSHWFTDISFNLRGEMIISFSDRIGHRYCKASTNRLDQQFPDILMVAFNPDTQNWELENNGVIAGRNGTGIDNGDGPGGGEFFGFDNWPTNPTYHNETALGSVFVLPGSSELVAAVYDPLTDSYSGGLHRYSTEDGSKTGAIELYSHTIYPVFGKATGFGDIIAKCSVQTIEIGNYVWNDTNGNGLQDADETGLGGVVLNLYDSECNLVGTTVTSDQGIYAFNSSNVDSDQNGTLDGVFPNTTYYVELDNTIYDENTGLYTFNNNEYTICTADAGSNADDMIDCDAQYNAASCLQSSFIEVNTTETNHSFDIALGTPSGFDLALKKEIVGNKYAQVGKEMIFMITIFNQGGVSASSATITDYIPSGFTFVQDSNPGWDNNGTTISTKITQKILPGTNVSRTLKLLVNSSQAANYTNVAEISEALTLSGEEAHDVDSTPDAIETNDNGGEPFTSTDDQINDGGEIDEDDHDPATPAIFDLAVRIKLADNKYYYGGDVVKFDIELYNQGNSDADYIKLGNYFPKELKFNQDLNPDWDEEGDYVVLIDENILAAGESRDYCIYFNISSINILDEIIDYIEILESSPVDHPGSFDFDSSPDNLNDNDLGGEIYTSSDNMVDDHGVSDEDDHDPAVIKTQFIDLALMKTTQKSRVKAGEEVIFDIEVINQGSVPAYKIDIIDYLPEYLTLVDDNWTSVGTGLAKRTLVLDSPLTKGNKVSTSIKVRVNEDVTPRAIVNYAEIVDVRDINNSAVGSKDIDSTPDEINNNDNGGVPNSETDNSVDSTRDVDEDDHDPARIVVISSNIESSECLANATNSNDGQYEEVFKITGPSGDEWYVASQNNYYSEDSPEPGDGPLVSQPTGEGELLTEMVIMPDNGMSMYTITLIRQDGDAAQLVVRSDDDEVETFNVMAETYPDVFISGNLALCDGETEEYCVINPDPSVTYDWSQNAGAGVIITDLSTDGSFSCASIDWSAAAPNSSYELNVVPDDGCYAPGSFSVGIGTSSGGMSCLGDVNLSLNGACEIQITPSLILTSPIGPGQAYNVMLTTQSGEVIPNATLTALHIGTTVTAKIIDACNGNSCWSSILVEDKLNPTIVCQDVTVSCNKIDEYGGPFAEDNCGVIASVTILKDSLTTLNCTDPGADEFTAVIDREYQATDAQGNKSEICKMRMFVEKVDLEDIVFPDTFLMMTNTALNCDAYDLDMDGVADLAITGVPVYNNEYVYPDFGQLCNTALSFEDDKRTINGVIKITRTWTAWRWDCDGTQTKIVDQLIEIRDTKPPSITCPNDINVSAVTGNCSGTVTLPVPQISDECSPDGLTYTIKPPFGALIKEGDSRVVTFPYSETPYDIVYTAIDGAGMSSTCTIQVTVNDNIAPVAICDQNTVVGLNSVGVGYAYALNIDDGSYDACGVRDIEIRRMDQGGPFSDKVIFDCADLGTPVIVELKVTDNAGLMNTCMTNVIVQDKHAPTVSGPANLEIECDVDYLPLSQFGEFSFTDACEVDTVSTAVISLNSCGLGTITRTFTASDSDGSASTSQTITIVNNNPFDFHSIVFPKDTILTINSCDVAGLTDPANLLDGYNVPQFTATPPCQMVSASPHDEMYSLLDDPNSVCFKIVRTWTVIDWCQLDGNGAPFQVSGVQTISVINTLSPDEIMVTGLDDPIIATTCDSAMVTFTASSSDCVPNNLQSLIQIDFNSDFNTTNEYELSIGGVGASTTFAQMLPMGNHTAVVTFMNPCNQMTTTSFPINITNNIPPNIGCKNVAIGLEPWDIDGIPGPDTEAACIYVDSLALESATFHMCDIDFELSFSDSSIVKELCFDCNDLGIQNVEIFAIDINGNISSCISVVEVQDNNDTDICMDVKDCVTFLQDTMVTLSFGCEYQVSDNLFNVTQVDVDCGPLTITHDYAQASDNTTLFGATFPLGTTVVTWSITNGVMIETCQLTILVKDELNPTIDCGSDVTINTSTLSGCTYTATGIDPTFADNCIVTTIEHNYGSAPSSTTLEGAIFPIGETTVVFTVTDGSNNTAICELVVTVNDNEGPAIECVDNMTFNDSDNSASDCAHTVIGNLLDPTANEECGSVASIVHNYAPAPSNTTLAGAEFQLGTTTVIFTATDNFGNTSTCEVDITVIDDIDPSVICAPAQTVNAGGNADCNFVQNGTGLDPVGTIENCEALGFTLTHNYDPNNSVSNTTLNGATFPIGIHTIIWTITDAAGNTSTCDHTVTVIDNTDPVCVDQGGPIDITIGGSESVTLTADDLNVQYTDACGPVTVTFTPATLDCDPEGIVEVIATVTDANNNSIDCPIQFNVIANVNVSCELNIDTVYLNANGQAVIVADDVVNIIGGGCGITYVPTIDISTFSCSDIDNNPITITISLNGEECGMDNITVLDTIAPVIACVVDQTLDDTADGINDCQFTVAGTIFDPSVTEACTPSIMTNDYNNEGSLDGAVFPVGGPYTITWTVTDDNGNVSICSHTITVVDDVNPECVDQGIIDITVQAGEEIIITEALLTAPFTDNCGVVSVTFNPTTITCDDGGAFAVIATVSDAAGNSSDCPVNFNVIVDDNITCTINIDTAYLNMDGEFTLDPASIVDITGGTCGGVQDITLSQTFASCNDVDLNPFDVTIFVNGVACGMDSIIVLDTIAPVLLCSNSEIACAEFEANFNSIAEFLETVPTNDGILDNCEAQLIVSITVDSTALNECNHGTILRTIVAEDPLSSLTDTCTQMITINGPADPLTQADVDGIVPATIETTGCTGVGSPDVTEITVADLEALVDCGQFTVAFIDVSISEGCPDTINRTYTIEAICQSETFTFLQQIVVNDTEDPTFATLADTTVVVNPSNCMASIDLSAYITAMDNCSAVDDIDLTYAYEGGNEMDVNTIDTLDAGTYTVTVTATDGCDNIAIDSFDLMVIDTSELVVSCAKLIVYLDTITGLVDVSTYEALIISGNCDNQQTIIASWDPIDANDSITVYNCDSFAMSPIIQLMYVYEVVDDGMGGLDTIPFDISPNVPGINNDCKVETEIRDSTNVCANTIFEIQGDVTTIGGEGIQNYRMTLHGSNTDAVLSNEEGTYAFPMMPEGGNYTIGTYKNDDVTNGVSTLDLIMIQRHILGLAEFDSPYKYIAADINNSEKITGADLLALRKVILGIDLEFSNNLSWRTIDAAHTFDDPTDPWSSPIPESYDVLDLTTNMYIDFLGVKIGDINGNASVNFASESTSTRSDKSVTLVSEYSIDGMVIETEEAIDVAGLQFTLITGDNVINSIQSDMFDESSIAFHMVTPGVYNISIANTLAQPFDEGDELFSIDFECMSCDLSEVILSSKGLASELYLNDDLEVAELNIENRDADVDVASFSVAQNKPNPWSLFTQVEVTMTEASDVTIRIFDVNGRLVYNDTESLNAGKNTIQLDDEKVNGAGVYFYEISTNTQNAQYKMIKLK